jgi:hypothetical protein
LFEIHEEHIEETQQRESNFRPNHVKLRAPRYVKTTFKQDFGAGLTR